MKAYKVMVETTDCASKTTNGPGKGVIGKDPYRECSHGCLYVVTDDPKKIYNEFPQTISIEEIGFGYSI